MKKTALLFIIFQLFYFLGFSQSRSKPLGVPIEYFPPKDYYFSGTTTQLNLYINTANFDRHKTVAWRIISDRPDNQTYVKPNATSGVQTTLKYLESYYVVDLDGEWVRIVRAEGGGLSELSFDKNTTVTDMGWIQRSKILQWTKGLLDPNSKIALKCIMLNKLNDIKNIASLKEKELVPIYDGPYSKNRVENKSIYNFFYILKKEGQRILLANQYQVGSTASIYITGWVDESRVEKWNTRVAIEPNFDEEAFKERKANENNRFMFFADKGKADDFYNRAPGAAKLALLDKDPVDLSPDKLSTENPRRYKGSIIRYPILENTDFLFKTGVIADIPALDENGNLITNIKMEDYAAVDENHRKKRENDKTVNIFFMIEGSPDNLVYRNQIIEIIDNPTKYISESENINFGCAIYRDIQVTSPEVPDLKIEPLSQNRAKVKATINDAKLYARSPEEDAYTIFRYSLNKVMADRWNLNQRNILVIVGNGADVIKDVGRRLDEAETHTKYYIPGDKLDGIYDKISQLDMNILFLQTKNEDLSPYSKQRNDILELFQEAANQIHNKNKAIDKSYDSPSPVIPDFLPGSLQESKLATNYYGHYTSNFKGTFDANSFTKIISRGLKELNTFQDKKLEFADRIIIGGESLDVVPGEFKPAVADLLIKYSKGMDLKALSGTKFQLFQQAWLPKKVKGAEHNLYAYVLFMPADELKSFKDEFNELANMDENGTMTEKRKELQASLRALVQKFSGEKSVTKADEMELDDVMATIVGLKQEGVDVFKKLNGVQLKDIAKESKFSNESINALVNNLVGMKEQLDRIYLSKAKYPYSFRHRGEEENIYFWIALDEILDESIL